MFQYKELFKPYARDGHTIENTYGYVLRECERRGIPTDYADLALQEVMLEVANGREFPRDYCPCGCGIDKSGTAITHEILARALAIDKKVRLDVLESFENKCNILILDFVRRENKAFTEEHLAPWYTRLRKRLEFECIGTPY
jgi:hypothetical protein